MRLSKKVPLISYGVIMGRASARLFAAFALTALTALAISVPSAGTTEVASDGVVCVAGRPPQDTIAECTKALSLPGIDNAARSNAMLLRGSAYAGLNRLDLAIEDFENAQKINYSLNVAVSLSGMYVNVGREQDAIAVLSKIVDAGMANAQIFNIRGAAYQNAGDFDASIDDFNKALFLNPKFLLAQNNRAAAYAKKGDYEKAAQDLDAVLAIDPTMAIALVSKCGVLVKRGNIDEGLPFCTQAEHQSPDNAMVIGAVGTAYYDAAKYEDALKYMDRAFALAPGNPFLLYARGMAKAKLGHKDDADADISEAIRIKPDIAAKSLLH